MPLGGRHHGLHLVGVGDVADVRLGPPARRLDARGCRLRAVGVDVSAQRERPLARQALGDRPSDARSRAGDDADLVLHAHVSIPFDMGAPILSLFDDQVKWVDDGHDSQTAHDARRGRALRRIGADRFQPGQQSSAADVRGDAAADRGGDGRARLSPQPDRPRAALGPHRHDRIPAARRGRALPRRPDDRSGDRGRRRRRARPRLQRADPRRPAGAARQRPAQARAGVPRGRRAPVLVRPARAARLVSSASGRAARAGGAARGATRRRGDDVGARRTTAPARGGWPST